LSTVAHCGEFTFAAKLIGTNVDAVAPRIPATGIRSYAQPCHFTQLTVILIFRYRTGTTQARIYFWSLDLSLSIFLFATFWVSDRCPLLQYICRNLRTCRVRPGMDQVVQPATARALD